MLPHSKFQILSLTFRTNWQIVAGYTLTSATIAMYFYFKVLNEVKTYIMLAHRIDYKISYICSLTLLISNFNTDIQHCSSLPLNLLIDKCIIYS